MVLAALSLKRRPCALGFALSLSPKGLSEPIPLRLGLVSCRLPGPSHNVSNPDAARRACRRCEEGLCWCVLPLPARPPSSYGEECNRCTLCSRINTKHMLCTSAHISDTASFWLREL